MEVLRIIVKGGLPDGRWYLGTTEFVPELFSGHNMHDSSSTCIAASCLAQEAVCDGSALYRGNNFVAFCCFPLAEYSLT